MEHISSIFCLFLLVAAVHGHSCRPCVRARCRIPVGCKGGIVNDACRCCQVCARLKNETCGGLYGTHGQCDTGLKCVIQPQHGELLNGQETGICKLSSDVTPSETCKEIDFDGCNAIDQECRCSSTRSCTNPFQFPNKLRCTVYLMTIEKSRVDCTNQGCSVRFVPNCPADSEVVDSVWPAGACCPLPSTCECRKEKCKQTLCRRGYDKVLVRKATGKPGACCDQYKCKARETECGDVICTPVNRNVTCSEDSVKISDRMSKDGCCELSPKCRCKSSVCPETKCSDEYRQLVAVQGNGKPGTCCDVIQCVRVTPRGSCHIGEEIYKHGETLKPEPCITCICTDGVKHCTTEQCQKLDCERKYIPNGKCCPKCRIIMKEPPTRIKLIRICTDDSRKTHLPGEVWFQDPCTRCVCKENGPECVASSCQKNCENPRPVEGECCGACDEPTYMTIPSTLSCSSMESCNLTGVECPFGFKSDDLGCRLCECRQKSEVCQNMSAACRLKCPRGFVVNDIGCEICQCKRSKSCRDMSTCEKDCSFAYRTNRGGCPLCRCRRCDDVDASCYKKCKHGRIVNNFGCEICKCRSHPEVEKPSPVHSRACVDGDVKHDDGEGWNTTSGHQCVCRLGQILCDMTECPVPHCDHPVIKNNSPCVVCPDSAPHSAVLLTCRNRVEGESWQADVCTLCVCNNGRTMCLYEECKPAPCEKPIFEEGHCCPSCPDEPKYSTSVAASSCMNGDSMEHKHGSLWRPDKCKSCRCENGEIRCFGEKCPQVHNCLNPVIKRGQCCPQCLDDDDMNICHVGDRNYTHSEVWSMQSDPCSSCSCVHGNILCRREVCRPLVESCIQSVRNVGECCNTCIEFGEMIVDPVPEEEPQSNLVPIFVGLGVGIAILLVGAVIVVFVVFKMKTKGPKVPYQQGHIVKRSEPASI